MGKVAEKIPAALSTDAATAEPAVLAITGEMQAFLASDVVYTRRVAALIKQALDDHDIGGQTIQAVELPAEPRLARPVDRRAADPRGRRARRGRERLDRSRRRPGLHGHGLLGVSVGDVTLQPARRGQPHRRRSADVTFNVKIANQGENDEHGRRASRSRSAAAARRSPRRRPSTRRQPGAEVDGRRPARPGAADRRRRQDHRRGPQGPRREQRHQQQGRVPGDLPPQLTRARLTAQPITPTLCGDGCRAQLHRRDRRAGGVRARARRRLPVRASCFAQLRRCAPTSAPCSASRRSRTSSRTPPRSTPSFRALHDYVGDVAERLDGRLGRRRGAARRRDRPLRPRSATTPTTRCPAASRRRSRCSTASAPASCCRRSTTATRRGCTPSRSPRAAASCELSPEEEEAAPPRAAEVPDAADAARLPRARRAPSREEARALGAATPTGAELVALRDRARHGHRRPRRHASTARSCRSRTRSRGRSASTLDTLADETHDVTIVGELVLAVSPCLIAREPIDARRDRARRLAPAAARAVRALPARRPAGRRASCRPPRPPRPCAIVVADGAPWAALGTRRAAELYGATRARRGRRGRARQRDALRLARARAARAPDPGAARREDLARVLGRRRRQPRLARALPVGVRLPRREPHEDRVAPAARAARPLPLLRRLRGRRARRARSPTPSRACTRTASACASSARIPRHGLEPARLTVTLPRHVMATQSTPPGPAGFAPHPEHRRRGRDCWPCARPERHVRADQRLHGAARRRAAAQGEGRDRRARRASSCAPSTRRCRGRSSSAS